MSGFGIGLALFALILGLVGLIKLLAWLDRVREEGWPALMTVNHSQVVMSPEPSADRRTERTDGADGPGVSLVNQLLAQLEVDRTKAAVIELLVYSDWTTAEIRAVVKGENATIGTEVEAARKKLGINPPERTIRVRDGSGGERVIPI